MELIESLSDAFIQIVTYTVERWPYMIYTMIVAVIIALLFNFLHVLLGGD